MPKTISAYANETMGKLDVQYKLAEQDAVKSIQVAGLDKMIEKEVDELAVRLTARGRKPGTPLD